MQKKNKPVFAFIDANNINLGMKSEDWTIDWGKFRLFLKNKYNVEKAFFFIGYIPSRLKMYKKLERLGFSMVFKKVRVIHHGRKIMYKGNIDAELVLHTMIHFNNFSSAIIASGDGDFYCLAQYLKDKNKLNKIIVPNPSYSVFLQDFTKEIFILSNNKDGIRKMTKIRGRSKP